MGSEQDAYEQSSPDGLSADDTSELLQQRDEHGAGETASPGDRANLPGDSFVRFLYNHNPFYLISCLLIIYGCQSMAISGGSLIDKSLRMAGGIALYTLLMALVCVAVVRIAKVWEDARSIFIVVVVSLVALTTGYDELCIGDQPKARIVGLGVTAFVVLITESLLRSCKIRLRGSYRLAFYMHFLVLIGFPLLLGYAVATRNDALANWGSVLFSVAIALGSFLLIPSLRRGADSVAENGTPWTWPLYPLSAFVVLLVLAGIRSHAIWMSFGFYGAAGNFEPFLLLPLFAAVVILIADTATAMGNQFLQRSALLCTPLLLFCGLSNDGATWLPIQSDLQYYFGSSLTVCFAVVFGSLLWMTIRGVPLARFGLPATLVAIGTLAPMPGFAEQVGLQSWMFPAAACAVLLWMMLKMTTADWLWTILAAVASTTIAMLGNDYGYSKEGMIAAAVFATVAMLIIGAVFRTDLATVLRHLAAAAMSVAVLTIVIRAFRSSDNSQLYLALLVAIVSLAYSVAIRRRGWLAVAVLQGLLFIAGVAYQGHRSGKLRRINWPIASGLMCLCVGVAITTGKTGMYRRFANRKSDSGSTFFKPGL